MGFKDAFKNFLGVPDDDYFEEDELEMSLSEAAEQREREKVRDRDRDHNEEWSSGFSDASERRGNKVVNIHATTQLQVVLVKPERYEDASSVADHLNEKRTVVLNLEQTKPDISRRILDFLCGVAYANNGQVKKVAASTYIITPFNVGVMGDLLDELENSGMIF